MNVNVAQLASLAFRWRVKVMTVRFSFDLRKDNFSYGVIFVSHTEFESDDPDALENDFSRLDDEEDFDAVKDLFPSGFVIGINSGQFSFMPEQRCETFDEALAGVVEFADRFFRRVIEAAEEPLRVYFSRESQQILKALSDEVEKLEDLELS